MVVLATSLSPSFAVIACVPPRSSGTLKLHTNSPDASVFTFVSDFVRSSKPVTDRFPTIVVQKISTSLFAGSAFALSVAGVPTVAPYGAVQMPCATGLAAICAKPWVSAFDGITAGPSVTVNGMCGKGREATTGCWFGFMYGAPNSECPSVMMCVPTYPVAGITNFA